MSTTASCSVSPASRPPLLGGLGSLRGALVGGLVVGVAQSLAVTQFGAEYAEVVPLGMLVVLLALRPEGLRR